MSFLFEVEADLAAILGLIFKHAKDVCSRQQMKFIGFDIRTDTPEVMVRVPPEYCTKVVAMIE